MLIVYTGPHDAVDVPAAGLVGVKRGEPVEVPDEVAQSLLAQGHVPDEVLEAVAEEDRKAARERAREAAKDAPWSPARPARTTKAGED